VLFVLFNGDGVEDVVMFVMDARQHEGKKKKGEKQKFDE
jgi:hypothetical protein